MLITDSYLRRLAVNPGAPDDSRLTSLRRRADAAVRAARAGNLDVMVGCDRRFWQEVAGLLGNRRIADYLDWLRVQSWMFAARYLRSMPELGGVCWDSHLDLVDAIEARDVPRAHRIVCEYNLFTVGLLAELAGQQVETVGVLPLLTGRPVAAPGGPGAQDGPVAAGASRTGEDTEAGSAPRPESAAQPLGPREAPGRSSRRRVPRTTRRSRAGVATPAASWAVNWAVNWAWASAWCRSRGRSRTDGSAAGCPNRRPANCPRDGPIRIARRAGRVGGRSSRPLLVPTVRVPTPAHPPSAAARPVPAARRGRAGPWPATSGSSRWWTY